ncbi:major facilitator superfamily domain-containing protein [Lipomyces chichibuensis]|uniref:major facilitator superfamily domain-containing protein n=1 Tax=Lipomyces chichibuensis TaxID=1546026 RepID=UPI00334351CB
MTARKQVNSEAASILTNESESTRYADDGDSHDGEESLLLQEQNRPGEWWKTPSVYLLIPAYLVENIARGGLLAPTINLTLQLVCRAYYVEQGMDSEAGISIMGEMANDCQIPAVHSRVSQLNIWISLIHSLTGALLVPKLGQLSDRLGRRSILMLSAVGPFVSEIMLILIARSNFIYSYRLIPLAYIVEGLTGSVAALQLTCQAYASDCTPPARRVFVFGLLRACFFGGSAFGPAIGAFIMRVTGDILSVFYMAMALQITFMLYVLLFLPESLSRDPHAQDEEEVHESSPLANGTLRDKIKKINIFSSLRVLWPKDGTRPVIKKNIAILATIEMMIAGCQTDSMRLILLYAEFVYGWSSITANYVVSFNGIGRALALLVILPMIMSAIRWLHPRPQTEVGASVTDIFVIQFSIICEMVSFAGMCIAGNTLFFAVFALIGSFGAIGSPTTMSTLTKHVPNDKVGAILGSVAWLQSIWTLFTPILFNSIYAYTVGIYTQAAFVTIIVFYFLTLVISLFVSEHVEGGLYDSGDGLDGAAEESARDMELEMEMQTEVVENA